MPVGISRLLCNTATWDISLPIQRGFITAGFRLAVLECHCPSLSLLLAWSNKWIRRMKEGKKKKKKKTHRNSTETKSAFRVTVGRVSSPRCVGTEGISMAVNAGVVWAGPAPHSAGIVHGQRCSPGNRAGIMRCCRDRRCPAAV